MLGLALFHRPIRSVLAVGLALAVVLALGTLNTMSFAQSDRSDIATQSSVPRFVTLDVVIDAGEHALGAYHVEFVAGDGVTLSGIYGGETGVFSQPPAYDAKALRRDKVALAAYSTETNRLPMGMTTVAGLSLMVETESPQWTVRVVAAADGRGDRIDVPAELIERTAE